MCLLVNNNIVRVLLLLLFCRYFRGLFFVRIFCNIPYISVHGCVLIVLIPVCAPENKRPQANDALNCLVTRKALPIKQYTSSYFIKYRITAIAMFAIIFSFCNQLKAANGIYCTIIT